MTFKRFQSNLIHLNAVDSTNNFAANLIKASKVVSGTTILTKRQDFGKGQRGKTWQSEENKNLIFSTVVYPDILAKDSYYLNLAAALAVQKTLEDLKIKAKIKWPNDILVDEKKISGILIENQISGEKINSSIIGVGLNVNQTEFDEELNATSILNEIGVSVLIEDVFNQLYAYLDFYFDHLMNRNFHLLRKLYYSKLFGLNTEVSFTINGQEYKGVIIGVDETGKLQVKFEKEGIRSFGIQEIKFNL